MYTNTRDAQPANESTHTENASLYRFVTFFSVRLFVRNPNRTLIGWHVVVSESTTFLRCAIKHTEDYNGVFLPFSRCSAVCFVFKQQFGPLTYAQTTHPGRRTHEIKKKHTKNGNTIPLQTPHTTFYCWQNCVCTGDCGTAREYKHIFFVSFVSRNEAHVVDGRSICHID